MEKWQSQVLENFNVARAVARDVSDECSILGGRAWAEGDGPLGNTNACVYAQLPDGCEPTGFMGPLGSQLVFTKV